MTDLPRTPRPRRGGRRPGWLLLTVLLVLAIGASSALVFTNKVELLKLAVILALWAAVVAAFVSVIYRRQSDTDQAKVRDLKLVYDLQLDREISARREYELSVETQLRRELVSELRAQAADEVAGLRAELAALRANLEILFDADLSERPAIETDRAGYRGYGEWHQAEPAAAGRVTASRIDTEDREDNDFRTDESPIIDVPEEPHASDHEWPPAANFGGAHRMPSDTGREGGRRRKLDEPARSYSPPPTPPQRTAPQPAPEPSPPPPQEPQSPWRPPQEPARPAEPVAPQQESEPAWRPAPAEGEWIPAGAPGSNWVAPPQNTSPREPVRPGPSAPPTETIPAVPSEQPEPTPPPQAPAAAAQYSPAPPTSNGSSAEYVGRRRAPDTPADPAPAPAPAEPAPAAPPAEPAPVAPPAMSAGPTLPRRGKHSAPADAVDPGRPGSAPTLAAEPARPPEAEPSATDPAARHRTADDPETGGQSVADLLARLQATPSGGGGRRRREE